MQKKKRFKTPNRNKFLFVSDQHCVTLCIIMKSYLRNLLCERMKWTLISFVEEKEKKQTAALTFTFNCADFYFLIVSFVNHMIGARPSRFASNVLTRDFIYEPDRKKI